LGAVPVVELGSGDFGSVAVGEVLHVAQDAPEKDLECVEGAEGNTGIGLDAVEVLKLVERKELIPLTVWLEDVGFDLGITENIVLRLDFVFDEAVASGRHMLL
jgi:hypothetical protein